MVLETLAIASLATGATSTYVAAKEYFATQRRNSDDHHSTKVRLAQSSAQGRPCIHCDWSTLRHLNSNSYKESCVQISFEMPVCCDRCKNLTQTVLDKYAPQMLADANMDYQKVRVRVPVETYGVVQRAVESAALAEKGSKERATGTFVAHISGRRASAVDKIAEMKWFPYILDRAFTNKASVVLPGIHGHYDGFLSTSEYSDCSSCPQDVRTTRKRAETILRRLRKLKSDELLTDVARQLLRYKKDDCLGKIEELMRTFDSDSIFTMELVRLKAFDASKASMDEVNQAIASSGEDESHPQGAAVPSDEDETGDSEDGGNANDINPTVGHFRGPRDFTRRANATEPAPQKKTRRSKKRTWKSKADLITPSVAKSKADLSTPSVADVLPLVTRDQFLSLRSNEETDLGFQVGKPRRLRRARKVAERGA